MIRECGDSDKERIFDYIGKDYGRCLYIYIDLKKISLDGDVFRAWIQEDESGRTLAVITEYYKGIQLYSRDGSIEPQEIADFLKEKGSAMIWGMKETIDKVKALMPGFEEEVGIVGKLGDLKTDPDPKAYSADFDELEEIVRLVAADEGIGKPYGYDSMYRQYSERMKDGFGRNFIRRDEANGAIICHAGTYAELPELAVIGGVITAPAYRGKGFSKGTLAAVCKELLDEGKDVFSFFYIPSALRMHYGVGFEKVGDWSKIFK